MATELGEGDGSGVPVVAWVLMLGTCGGHIERQGGNETAEVGMTWRQHSSTGFGHMVDSGTGHRGSSHSLVFTEVHEDRGDQGDGVGCCWSVSSGDNGARRTVSSRCWSPSWLLLSGCRC